MTQPPSQPPSEGSSGPSPGDSSQDSSKDSVQGSETPRGGRVTIVGRPNVGKSTLLNSLLGQKLAITTSRPGTTRANVLGVYSSAEPPTQIAFLDTPGMARPKTALHRLLGELARGGLSGVDAVVLMTDRAGKDGGVFEPDRAVLETIRETGAPIVLVLNKADRFKPRDKMLPLLARWQEAHDFAAIVPTVATTGKNVDALVRELREIMPEGFLYEPDYLTDRPERFFAAELVREAVMRHTREEVPYGAAVLIEEWDDEPNITRIHAVLVVEKPSHKKIVIGAGGSMLKTIGTEARLQIEELLQRKAYLKLWVKVVPGWTDSPGRVRELTGATEG